MKLNWLKRASLCAALLGGSFYTYDLNYVNAQNAPAAEPLMEQKYKNIQALKGVPASQMRPLMNLISASLGMKCDECHVKTGNTMEWEKDDNAHKVTARKMITMTMDINKNSFGGRAQISCYTCHQGHDHPVHIPSLAAMPAPAPAKPVAPALKADEVLAKYAAAVGKDAAAKVTSRSLKGQLVQGNGQTVDYELTYGGAGKLNGVVKNAQGIVATQMLNGESGWLKAPQESRALENVELARLKSLASALDPLPLREPYPRLNYGGIEKVGEREAYVLRGMTPDRKRVRYYIDAESGLLVRRVTVFDSVIGPDTEQFDFEDYRDVEGVKVPFSIRSTYFDRGANFTRKFTEIKHNVKVDDALFNQPK
jgi:Photosynthetic reaction centre cytochrome C subunit